MPRPVPVNPSRRNASVVTAHASPPARNPRWGWLGWTLGLSLASTWLVLNVMAARAPAEVPAPTPSAQHATPVVVGPSPEAGAARALSTASPSPADRYAVVANTGGIGVYLRRTPRLADKVKAWPDGTTLLIVGQDGTSEGRVWKQVRDPDGNVGWVPAEYVLPEQPIERPASAPPTALAPPKLQPMFAANGQRCWSGPDWEAPLRHRRPRVRRADLPRQHHHHRALGLVRRADPRRRSHRPGRRSLDRLRPGTYSDSAVP